MNKIREAKKAVYSEQFTWLMQGLAIEQPKAIKKDFKHYDLY